MSEHQRYLDKSRCCYDNGLRLTRQRRRVKYWRNQFIKLRRRELRRKSRLVKRVLVVSCAGITFELLSVSANLARLEGVLRTL